MMDYYEIEFVEDSQINVLCFVEYKVHGKLFRDVYQYKPTGYGDMEPDLLGVEVLTPKCGFMPAFGFPSCTKMCNTKCHVAQECMEELEISL